MMKLLLDGSVRMQVVNYEKKITCSEEKKKIVKNSHF